MAPRTLAAVSEDVATDAPIMTPTKLVHATVGRVIRMNSIKQLDCRVCFQREKNQVRMNIFLPMRLSTRHCIQDPPAFEIIEMSLSSCI
jgi:hypothetical protein